MVKKQKTYFHDDWSKQKMGLKLLKIDKDHFHNVYLKKHHWWRQNASDRPNQRKSSDHNFRKRLTCPSPLQASRRKPTILTRFVLLRVRGGFDWSESYCMIFRRFPQIVLYDLFTLDPQLYELMATQINNSHASFTQSKTLHNHTTQPVETNTKNRVLIHHRPQKDSNTLS